jgi:hypothetical protein
MAIVLLGVLAACTRVTSSSGQFLKPGTIYSSRDGEQIVAHDAGNSYAIDAEGNLTISYRHGEVIAHTPLKLDMTRNEGERGISAGGFFISEDKTAIVYQPQPDPLSPLHVLISNDRGTTWHDYIVPGAKGNELFIGFTSDKEGWMVSGASHGVARALNYVYQTSDGGKTWREVGSPNDIYSEHLTGVGFSNQKIGFFGFRYYKDAGPEIYWTKDQGHSWEKLVVTLPDEFKNDYNKTPLSPIFNGEEGLYPILLTRHEDGQAVGTLYLYSKDGGLTWAYDGKYDKL